MVEYYNNNDVGFATDSQTALLILIQKRFENSPTHYALNSPKAELKVNFFLNVGLQQGCKVVTSGTSVKINVFFD